MSLLDWTKSQTTSPPATINVAWQTIPTGNSQPQTKTQALRSTDVSTSTSVYQSLSYLDASGVVQSQDVVVRKEDIRKTTRARVNLEYVSERLKYGRGLPSGDDLERSVTTYEYRSSTDGPKLVKEVTTVYFSGVALAGQLQGVLYAWNNPGNASSYLYYDPPTSEFVSHETIVEYEESKGADGRDYTRTKTSRWICAANNSEAKGSFVKWMQAVKSINQISVNDVSAAVLAYTDLLFEGTEVQVNIGRAPVPAKPSDAELAADEVTNGTNIPFDATPTEVFGNDLGWTAYVPPGTDWQDYNVDSDGDGVPDWAAFVPDSFEDYNFDSDSDGVPDWAAYVPPSVDWQDFNFDGDADGIPDWAAYVPPAVDWQDVNIDTNNDGVPDWAIYVPPGQNWQDFVTDPLNWQSTAIDTNNDGIPDWADLLPTGNWEDYVTDPLNWQSTAIDSNGDGIPDWASNLPSGNWQDYVTDPTDWENTAIDSNGDGIPDWADNTPIGWEEFNGDTNFTNPEPEVNNDKSITGQVVFDGQSYNDGSATVTASYQMPFAPDDYFYYEKGIRKLYRSGAQQAAIRFGQTEAALDIGHAFGQNIVTNFDLTPTLDLSPVYIRLAGIEGAFLLDAPSYAWGPEGMVVSSDLMLLGVTGYDGASAPPTSWLRLPVAPAGIGPAGSTTIEASPVKANSINIPGGFNVRSLASVFAALPTNGADVFKEWRSNTSLVTPTLTLDRQAIAAGPGVRATEFSYELSTGSDAESLASGPTIDFIWVTVVSSPAAGVTVAGLAPGLATGASVAVPVVTIQVAANSPAIKLGIVIDVPAAQIGLSTLVPESIGKPRLLIQVPSAGLTVAAQEPSIQAGTVVAIPAAQITFAGLAPSQVGLQKDDYWSDWALQNYEWYADLFPDWWAN